MSERKDRCKAVLTFRWKPTVEVLREVGDGRDTLDAVRQNLDALVREGFAEKRTIQNGPVREAQYRIRDAPYDDGIPPMPSKADRLRARLTDEWAPTRELIKGGDGLTHQDLWRLLRRGEVERRTALSEGWRGNRIAITEWRLKPREAAE